MSFTFQAAFVIGAILAISLCGDVHAQIVGDPANLKLVADLHEANVATIKTWSGRAKVTDRFEEEDEERLVVNSEVVFFSRPITGELRWNWAVTSTQGESRSKNPPLVRNGLVTENRFVWVGRLTYPDSVGVQIEIKDPAALSSGMLEYSFVPMSLFKGSGDVVKNFRAFYRLRETMHDWTVSRTGDIVTLQCKKEVTGSGQR
ncbi:unnamed protein product, partial [marine sediment metagenome]